VPALLDALKDDKLSVHRRGWLLGLLYAITCEEDLSPFGWRKGPNVLPDYECRCGGCESSCGNARPDALAAARVQPEMAQAPGRLLGISPEERLNSPGGAIEKFAATSAVDFVQKTVAEGSTIRYARTSSALFVHLSD
jgi:hypothetical protein